MFNFFKKENVIYYLLLLKAKISYYYDEAIKYLFNVNNIIHYNAGEKKIYNNKIFFNKNNKYIYKFIETNKGFIRY